MTINDYNNTNYPQKRFQNKLKAPGDQKTPETRNQGKSQAAVFH